MSDNTNDQFLQHGIDDNLDDTKKGMELEALGSGAAAALADTPLGAMGGVVGALMGSSIGTVVSGEPMQPIDFEGDWDKYAANSSASQEGSTETTSSSDTSSASDA